MKSIFGRWRSRHSQAIRAVRQRPWTEFRAVSLVLVFACLSPSPLRGQQAKPSEYQIKAVYLYNFSRFVEWPTQSAWSKTEPFAICILGKDPFGPTLDTTLSVANTQGRSLVAKRISRPRDALSCQILFVASSEEARLREIFGVLEKTSVLTVSDISRFSERGGMIQFVLQGDRVRFEVNLTNATDAGLVLGSDLLKVALAVRRNSQSCD